MEGRDLLVEREEISQDTKSNFLTKQNSILGILFIVVGILLLINGHIMKIPHHVSEDKKPLLSDKEDTRNLYMYDHEKGGDRKLRMTASYMSTSMGIICFVLAGLIMYGMNDDLQFKNKTMMMVTGVVGLLLVCCATYYIINRRGVLNEKENEKFEKQDIQKLCGTEGKAIIYNTCAGDEVEKLYNECIKDTRDRARTTATANLIAYQNANRTLQKDENGNLIGNPAQQVLDTNGISQATYNKYRQMDKNPNEPLTNERVVNILVENNPKNQLCREKAFNEFKKTDRHVECTRKSEKQSVFDINNVYSQDNLEGCTFQNCVEKEKYLEIKNKPVNDKITQDISNIKLSIDEPGNVPVFTETSSGGTVTQQVEDVNSSGGTSGGSSGSREVGGVLTNF